MGDLPAGRLVDQNRHQFNDISNDGVFGSHNLKSCHDLDQNAVIINGGNDLRKSQTWAYRYKRKAAD